MQLKELYEKLMGAYSDANLNRISAKLISLYKSKNFAKIRELANKVDKYVAIDEEKDARCFTKLIMLYHPDKGKHFRQTIDALYQENDHENLEKHAHILSFSEVDSITVEKVDEAIEFNPEYEWDIQENHGFNYAESEEQTENGYETEDIDYEKSFFNLIKIREYGRLDIALPTYYLEDFEEFEMAYSGLESLSGVEYCKHVKILDVSNNSISELNDLWDLSFLEELYLSNNQIGYIDALSNLQNLRILDLSENQIHDITALMDLPQLAYVNLLGNQVPINQVETLERKGVLTVYEKRVTK